MTNHKYKLSFILKAIFHTYIKCEDKSCIIIIDSREEFDKHGLLLSLLISPALFFLPPASGGACRRVPLEFWF